MFMSVTRAQRLTGSARFRRSLPTWVVAAALVGSSSAALTAAEDGATKTAALTDTSNEALLRKLDAMEKRIRMLEGQLKDKHDVASASDPKPESKGASTAGDPKPAAASGSAAKPAPSIPSGKPKAQGWASAPPTLTPMAPPDNGILGLQPSPVNGLSIGAYGVVIFGSQQNPTAGGHWQNGFDARRMVLLPTYAITDNIIFNAEIEFEHAGAGFDNDDKLHRTAEIEQLWVDFKIMDQFNVRAPGIDLVPIGFINQHHEPTQFYSVRRPELYNGLIPSTWKVPATSVYGTVTDGVKYQVMLSMSNEDFGDSFDARTGAKTVPPPGTAYAPGIDGKSALGFSLPPLGDFQQLVNNVAVSGRLDLAPPAVPGFAGSVSAYYSSNTTPRGAHDDLGDFLGKSSLTMFDAEFRYRVPQTGLELRGEYVKAMFGNPANLCANNDSDPTNNVGKAMVGYSAEAAYHIAMGTILGSEWEAVPFYRYTYENLQTAGFAGTDVNGPTGAGQMQFHSAGIAVFPSQKLVLKATYQKVINKDPAGAKSDSILGGVGFFF